MRDGQIVGFMPYTYKKHMFGWRKASSALTNPFIMSSHPLIAPNNCEQTAFDLIAGLHAVHKGVWRFPYLSVNRKTAHILKMACDAHGFLWHEIKHYQRAVLHKTEADGTPRTNIDHYFDQHISKNRRKNIKRRRSNLQQAGDLKHVIYTLPDDLKKAYEMYVQIEMKGWKGNWGSALGVNENTHKLGEALFTSSKHGAQARADMLTLNDQPIAISLSVLQQRSVYGLKTTYDEAFAHYSPGLLLEKDIIRDFLTCSHAELLDSASLPGCVVEDLWADRETVSDIIIVTDPALNLEKMQPLLKTEAIRQKGYETLKNMYHRWRS